MVNNAQNTKITGGEFKGREILSTKDPRVHPMSSRARLGLFNALKKHLDFEGAQVLDAFAGTGALGFEALSRGAAHVTFVDKNRRAVDIIRQNAKRLGVESKITIIRANVKRYRADRPYDLVFFDPPYMTFDKEDWVDCAASATEYNRTIIAVSHPKYMLKPGGGEGMPFVASDKQYGECNIMIFDMHLEYGRDFDPMRGIY